MMSNGLGSAIVSWFTPSKRKRDKENVDPLLEPNCYPPPAPKKLCPQERVHLGLSSCKRELFPSNHPATTKTKLCDHESIQSSTKMASSGTTAHCSNLLLNGLPLEMVHLVFQYLDTESLGTLSTLSKDLNATVLNYLESGQGLKQLLPRHFGMNKIKTPRPEIFGEAGKY